MKKAISLFLIILAGISVSGFAQEMTLDIILNKYFETVGMKKMNEWKSMKMTGKSMAQGVEYPFFITVKRPGKVRMEVDIQGMKMIQAYDGQKGWAVIPWSGSTDPQDMTEDQSRMMKNQAEFEGSLYNWKDKGYKAELLGKEDVEGSSVYKIKVTKPDGDIETFFIDAENFVILKSVTLVKIQGNETESETLMSDYKDENGVLIPHTIVNKYKDQVVSQVVVDKVDINPDMDDSIFQKPVKK